MKNNSTRGLFDEEFRLEKIASKDPLSIFIDQGQLGAISLYSRKKPLTKKRTSNAGRPSFDRLMMFKILILQELYGLSDQIEFQLLDRLSFQVYWPRLE
ncbi:MAG: transposase [Bacteroidetes bacterium]|nr:transposase [Bacteroidota bacterium]